MTESGSGGQLTPESAGNQGRDKMREKNHSNRRKATGRPVGNPPAPWPVYATEHRETVRQGLRILARIIARAHLGRQAERSAAHQRRGHHRHGRITWA